MTQKKTSKPQGEKARSESRLMGMFAHGSSGQLVVLLVVVLITAGYLIWAASQGSLGKYIWMIVLLAAVVIAQLILFFRARARK